MIAHRSLSDRLWTIGVASVLAVAAAFLVAAITMMWPLVGSHSAALVVGAGVGVLAKDRIRDMWREVAHYLGEEVEAQKYAERRRDPNYVRISGEQPVVSAAAHEDELEPDPFVSTGKPPEPYCPCGGVCHEGENPCSFSCLAHHTLVTGGLT